MNPTSVQNKNIFLFEEFVDMIKTKDNYIRVVRFLVFCAEFSATLNKQYGICVGIVEIFSFNLILLL